MPSTFTATDASAYELQMGRWSRRLAVRFVDFAGLAPGERLLDLGCGTGSLSAELATRAEPAAIVGVDLAEPYVEHARVAVVDPRARFQVADACDLPFAADSFERVLSLLVLQFIPDPAGALAEAARVVRPGGGIAATVWQSGGLPAFDLFWRAAETIDPGLKAKRAAATPNALALPGGFASLWRAQGLIAVDEARLRIIMDFADFDDYWLPFTGGQGSAGSYTAGLAPARRDAFRDALRGLYEAEVGSGPLSAEATAIACKGKLPG